MQHDLLRDLSAWFNVTALVKNYKDKLNIKRHVEYNLKKKKFALFVKINRRFTLSLTELQRCGCKIKMLWFTIYNVATSGQPVQKFSQMQEGVQSITNNWNGNDNSQLGIWGQCSFGISIPGWNK